eukprot:CAMPEP_0182575816 /NCGR_PEP_ID=MMETSP1324-20130603/31610_1 /TAXON_ID=236786 /ORGANISM="Florenciella sp., Strain RCC1587" /LENGTH=34 /DNA_ID= /DNA_START= /DNA_END= /DNA_ORIENTATION=
MLISVCWSTSSTCSSSSETISTTSSYEQPPSDVM